MHRPIAHKHFGKLQRYAHKKDLCKTKCSELDEQGRAKIGNESACEKTKVVEVHSSLHRPRVHNVVVKVLVSWA